MTTPKSPRTLKFAALAAFGLVSLGSIAAAGAHPNHGKPVPLPRPIPPSHYDDYGYQHPMDYDLDGDGILEHVELDYRHYDRNRDGVLSANEKTAYWTHMFDMGKFGTGFSKTDKVRLARIARFFDVDGDGRLTQNERVAISRLIRARKVFVSLDRNRDNNVTRWEAGVYRRYDNNDDRYYIQGGIVGGFGFWYGNDIRAPERTPSRNWVALRFGTLDRNNNGRVSWNEVEGYLVTTFRRGILR